MSKQGKLKNVFFPRGVKWAVQDGQSNGDKQGSLSDFKRAFMNHCNNIKLESGRSNRLKIAVFGMKVNGMRKYGVREI